MSLKKLGRYDIIKPIGKGAMGLVYEAHDPNINRAVAIKTIRVDQLSEDMAAEYESRFRSETQAGGRLQHPNIIGVYDAGRDQGLAYIVMELVRGGDLRQQLDQGRRLTFDRSMVIMKELLSALSFAHEQGIIHRDVKPANVMLDTNGRVKLGDFGVARITDGGEATRTQGSMVGTLKYMSPEQVIGAKVDARTDLFAAGVVLYQLLTGTKPFEGDSDFAIMQAIAQQDPPLPSTLNLSLPAGVDAVVFKALAKNRDNRYATAKDFALALRAVTQHAAAGASAPPPTASLPPAVAPRAPESGASATSTGAGSRTQGNGSSTSSSAVSQEMELLYWKDIQDSADPEDFHGFLQQFPSGVYAGLAQRRLRKLATTLSERTGSQSVAGSAVSSLQARLADAAATPPVAPQAPATVPLAAPPMAPVASPGSEEYEATRVAPPTAPGVDQSAAGRAAREAAIRLAAEDAAHRQVDEARRRADEARGAELARTAAEALRVQEAQLAREARQVDEARQLELAAQAKKTDDAARRAADEARRAQAREADKARSAAQERAAREAQVADEHRRAEEARKASQAKEAEVAEAARRAAQATLLLRRQEQEQAAEIERQAAAARQADAKRLAEADRLIEVQRTEAARLIQEALDDKQAFDAEEARKRAELAENDRKIKEAEASEKARQAQAALEAKLAEEKLQAEVARKAEAKRSEALKARQAALAQQAEQALATRKAEAERSAEEARKSDEAKAARRAQATRDEDDRKSELAQQAAELRWIGAAKIRPMGLPDVDASQPNPSNDESTRVGPALAQSALIAAVEASAAAIAATAASVASPASAVAGDIGTAPGGLIDTLLREPAPVAQPAMTVSKAAVKVNAKEQDKGRLIAIAAAIAVLGGGGVWFATRDGVKRPVEISPAPRPAPAASTPDAAASTPPRKDSVPAPTPAPTPIPIVPRVVQDAASSAVPPEIGSALGQARALERNDRAAAMAAYEKIANGADKKAAADAARRLWELNRDGDKKMASNPEQAQRWYDRARKMGVKLPVWTAERPGQTPAPTPSTPSPTPPVPAPPAPIPITAPPPPAAPAPLPAPVPAPPPPTLSATPPATPPAASAAAPVVKASPAELYERGQKLESTSPRQAEAAYREAAQQGHGPSQKRMWELLSKTGRESEAVRYQRDAWEQKVPGVPEPKGAMRL